MTETSSGYKLLGVMTSSMKQATTSLMLKNVDPEFAKEAKYFTGQLDTQDSMANT